MSFCILKSNTENIINELSVKIKKETNEYVKNINDVSYLRQIIYQISNGVDVPFDNILYGVPQMKKYDDSIDEYTGYYKAGYLNIVLLKRKIDNDIKLYNMYKGSEDKNDITFFNKYKNNIENNKDYIKIIELEIENLKILINSCN